MPADRIITTSGKRKTAIARATVCKGKGRTWINHVPLEILSPEVCRSKIREALALAGEKTSGVDVDVRVSGGGVMGQASAARTAIARGLVRFLEDRQLEEVYRSYDRMMLVNDSRKKLPKKPQGRGARKRRQKSYR